MLRTILLMIQVALCLILVTLTLTSNVKGEGLGSIGGQTESSYRGVLGGEERMQVILKNVCYTFLAASFLVSWLIHVFVF